MFVYLGQPLGKIVQDVVNGVVKGDLNERRLGKYLLYLPAER
jgi:hypothetical protein